MIINDMPSNQDKAFALSYLAFYASESNPKATLPWLNEAMNISTKINNDKLWYWVYARYANTLSILGQTEEALQYYQISNQHAVKASYEWGRVQNLTHIANIYFSWGNYEKAFEYAYANLQAREDKETNFGLGFAHYHLGYLYYNIEDYPEAFYHFSKAATIYKEINLNEYAGLMIQEKAKILVAQNKLDSALVLSGQAMKLFEQSEDKSFKGKLHRDIGNIYFLKEDYTLALSNFFTA